MLSSPAAAGGLPFVPYLPPVPPATQTGVSLAACQQCAKQLACHTTNQIIEPRLAPTVLLYQRHSTARHAGHV